MVVLSGVRRGKKETMCVYIDRFTNVAVVVRGLNKSLKYLIFEKGLRPDCSFREKLGCKKAYNLKDLPIKAQPYINYE